MLPLLPVSMEGLRAADLRTLVKEIVNRRIEMSKIKSNDSDSEEEDLDEMFLGFTEEQIQQSLHNVEKRKLISEKDEIMDKRIRTCSVNLSRSKLLIKDVYIGNHCHNCKEVKSDICIPINYTENQSTELNPSSLKFKKIVFEVFKEQCFISVSIPENVTICTKCKDRKSTFND